MSSQTLLPRNRDYRQQRLTTSPTTFLKSMSKKAFFTLKTPKGTKDWADKDMVIRTKLFDIISGVFSRHGAVTIDTPVMELREILSGKYGEDSKLIYNLEDQGGEITSLRYDLTVPFARFVAMNGIKNIKRYHIAKVYRRDQPAMTKGRMREFYQCDFDVAGAYDPMVPDAECLSICTEVLDQLKIKDYTIKVSHRLILDGLFTHCGVPENMVRTISSAVDKLDKLPWEDVKKEMTVEKGLDSEVAERIGSYVRNKGSLVDIIELLQNDAALMENQSAVQGLSDMRALLQFTNAYGITNRLSFDLSLARGLDYYTGLIYEVVTAASAPPPESAVPSSKHKPKNAEEDVSEYVGVGSIAAGGRYDRLVGMFSNQKKNSDIPCVGISFGVERLFSILKQAGTFDYLRPTATQVFVMAFGGGPSWTGFLPERMAMARQLWDAGVEAEYMYKAKPKLQKQFEAAERSGAKLAVILGQDEQTKGICKIKVLGQGEHAEGDEVQLADVTNRVKALLSEA